MIIVLNINTCKIQKSIEFSKKFEKIIFNEMVINHMYGFYNCFEINILKNEYIKYLKLKTKDNPPCTHFYFKNLFEHEDR